MTNEQIDRLLAALKNGIDPNDASIPAEVREMMKRAEAQGAKVAALTVGQLKELGLSPEMLEKLSGLALQINPDDALDPHAARYQPVIRFSPLINEEALDRLNKIVDGPEGLDALFSNDVMPDEDFRLCMIALGELEIIGDGEDLTGEDRALVFALRHSGFENIFDAHTSGPYRLKRMGFGKAMISRLSSMVHQSLLPIQARTNEKFVIDLLAELTTPVALDPLPEDDTFNQAFDSAFMRKRFSPNVLAKLSAGGLDTLGKVFESGSMEDVAEIVGLTHREMEQFGASLAACAETSPEAEDEMDILLDRATARATILSGSPFVRRKMEQLGGEDFKMIQKILGEIGLDFLTFSDMRMSTREAVIDLFKAGGQSQEQAEHSADHLRVHIDLLNKRALQDALNKAAELGPQALDEVLRRLPSEMAEELAPVISKIRTAVNMKAAADAMTDRRDDANEVTHVSYSTAVDQPVVRAALTADTVNTLLDHGLTDLQMISGDMPAPCEPHTVLKKLSASERGDIRDIGRVLENCQCGGCQMFRKEYFAEYPRIKVLLDAQSAESDGKNLH